MNTLQIIAKMIELLGQRYQVINAYNNSEQINLDGVIAVTVSAVESLNHGTSKDSKFTLNISGQTLTDQDINQSRINQMFDYVFDTLKAETIKENINNCAGVLLNIGNITSDGQANTFQFQIDLFICID